MKSIVGTLGRGERAKQGNVWDWIKSQPEITYFFYIAGYTTETMNIFSTERWRAGKQQ